MFFRNCDGQEKPQRGCLVRRRVAADLFLSVVTIGEIELGISRQQHLNPVFAQQLADWVELTLRAYGERILPLTVGSPADGVGLQHSSATNSLI